MHDGCPLQTPTKALVFAFNAPRSTKRVLRIQEGCDFYPIHIVMGSKTETQRLEMAKGGTGGFTDFFFCRFSPFSPRLGTCKPPASSLCQGQSLFGLPLALMTVASHLYPTIA